MGSVELALESKTPMQIVKISLIFFGLIALTYSAEEGKSFQWLNWMAEHQPTILEPKMKTYSFPAKRFSWENWRENHRPMVMLLEPKMTQTLRESESSENIPSGEEIRRDLKSNFNWERL